MFLTKVHFSKTVKNLYLFKLRAMHEAFIALIGIQILSFLFTSMGISSMSSGSGNYYVELTFYSADITIVFTMIWAFMCALQMTTKAYRFDDFTFVANRLSSNVANLLFLTTASIVGGVTAMLAGGVLKASIFFRLNDSVTSLNSTLGEWLFGVVGACFYVLLAAALGYFIGSLNQIHRFIGWGVSVILIGFFFTEPNWFVAIFRFFFMEASFLLFTLKVLLATGAFFALSIAISNRNEVHA